MLKVTVAALTLGLMAGQAVAENPVSDHNDLWDKARERSGNKTSGSSETTTGTATRTSETTGTATTSSN